MHISDAAQLSGASASLTSGSSGSKSQVEDLFSAHDFDIQIDLPTNNEGTCIFLTESEKKKKH